MPKVSIKEGLKALILEIFSVTNSGDKCHKIVTILGLKLKFKSQKLILHKRFDDLQGAIEQQSELIDNLYRHNEELIQNQKELVYNLSEENRNLKKELNRTRNNITAIERNLLSKIHKYCPDDKRAIALQDWYFERTGETLNLENPETFNDKIQWLKLYDSTPIKTRLADKYLVRDWVKEKIGEECLIPLLGVWDKFDDIDFDNLPNQFVLKCNHGCGYNIIVTDKSKLDIEEARKKINYWMNEDYAFKFGFELHYSPIPRKIIAEEYLEDESGNLQDYKFLCFDGEPELVWVDRNRYSNHKRNVYDLDWNLLQIKINKYDSCGNIPKPENLSQMVKFAKVLSSGFNMVRVDFYVVNNCVYFGEMTFTSSSGTSKIEPESEAYRLGSLIRRPEKHT